MIKEKYSNEQYERFGKQEVFSEAWIAKDNDEYLIIHEIFIKEGNTGWTYEPLASGFKTVQQAEKWLQDIFQ